jgi:5-methylthioadenosine/S-adenosylhomocysteine deaminase
MEADLLITNGTVVTMNPQREVIEDGAVAVVDDEIAAVGRAGEIRAEYDAARVIDAAGHAVLPGFISTHAHVSDILFRGMGNDRSLYDWLFNIFVPGISAMTPDEHAVASALYAAEGIRSGLTTVVEFGVGTLNGYEDDVLDEKFGVYEDAGFRNVYAHSLADKGPSGQWAEYIDAVRQKEPAVDHPVPEYPAADDILSTVERRIEAYHGTAEGRQSVWPAPSQSLGVTPEALRGSLALAEEYDVMTTTHNSEVPLQERHLYSNVEYLRNVGYLSERTLLAHSVYLDDRDIRMVAGTGAKVAHNPMTNFALGDGIAPIPDMIDAGITVGLGTDNTSASDTVTMAPHLRATALVHKAQARDAGAITGEKVLEMATVDAARAIGRGEDLGTLEAGKLADLILVDLTFDHMTPHPNVASTLVYQAQGREVDTVVCNGEVVMEDGAVPGIEDRFPDLRDRATEMSEEVVERVGLSEVADRGWVSRSAE